MAAELIDIILIVLVPALAFGFEIWRNYFRNYTGSKSYRAKMISVYTILYLIVIAITFNRIIKNRDDRRELREQIQVLRGMGKW